MLAKRRYCDYCGKEIRDIGFYLDDKDEWICGECYYPSERSHRRGAQKKRAKLPTQKIFIILSLFMVLLFIFLTMESGGKLFSGTVSIQTIFNDFCNIFLSLPSV